MVRTRIQLQEGQLQRLRALAAVEGRSVADRVRESVDALRIRRGGVDPETVRRRALEAIGLLEGAPSDPSTHHDRYLGEALEP